MQIEKPTTESSAGELGQFSSNLAEGRQRFLAHVIEHSFQCERRTPRDFIRHFPPRAIMEGLKDRPPLRAKIVSHTTGTKPKIALKKPWESAADDLQIALDEKETDAAAVVSVFDPDDRVRYLDAQRIWSFLIEGEFWTQGPSNKRGYGISKEHVAFMLERALVDKLLTHRDIVEGITVGEIASKLPKKELGLIIEGALASGHESAPFTEVELLAAMPPAVLVEHLSLTTIYDSVIVPRIADRHGYAAASSSKGDSQRSSELTNGTTPSEVPRTQSSPPMSQPLSQPSSKTFPRPAGSEEWVDLADELNDDLSEVQEASQEEVG